MKDIESARLSPQGAISHKHFMVAASSVVGNIVNKSQVSNKRGVLRGGGESTDL